MKKQKADVIGERWRGKWAIVTGASAGIGKAIVEELASAGTHLVLVARRAQRLNAIAESLSNADGVQAEACPADLAEPDAPRQIFEFTQQRGLRIDLLVNNAGLNRYSEFHAIDLAAQLAMVQVHCHAVLHLTHLFWTGMVERRSGDILIVSSVSAFPPGPYTATYAATKGFDLLLAEGLAEEVARYGVRASALCPGATESEMYESTGAPKADTKEFQSAKEVARRGREGLAMGKHCVIPAGPRGLTATPIACCRERRSAELSSIPTGRLI